MAEKLISIKLRYLERMYSHSLFRLKDHWVTFLGCDGENMVFYDSSIFDSLNLMPKVKVAKIATAVLVKGGENMEKNFSETDFSKTPEELDFFTVDADTKAVFPDVSDAEWKRLQASWKNPPVPDDPNFYTSDAYVKFLFPNMTDAEWERLEDYCKNPPEFVRSMQATFNPNADHSHDFEDLMNLNDIREQEDTAFLLEYSGNFSEAKMVSGFTIEEWRAWKEKEKDRIARLKKQTQ